MKSILALDLYNRIKQNLPVDTKVKTIDGYTYHGIAFIDIRNACRSAIPSGGLNIHVYPISYEHAYYDSYFVRLRKGWTDRMLRNACNKIMQMFITEARLRALREEVKNKAQWVIENEAAIAMVNSIARTEIYMFMTYEDCEFWLAWLAENKPIYVKD